MDFDTLADCDVKRTPGVETDSYWVCACDVVAPFPQPPTSGPQGATMVITDDIILKPLKAWKKIRIIINSGELKNEQKNSGFDQMFDFKTVTDENYDEWFNEHGSNPNPCMLVIVPQKDGKNRLMGHPTKGPVALINAKSTQGLGTDTNAEWTGTLQASPGNVAYYYEGDIDLDPLT